MTDTYMKRLAARRRQKRLKSDIIFGLVLGWALVFMGAFNYFFAMQGGAWLAVLFLGTALLATAVVIPELLELPQSAMRRVGTAVATPLFKLILALFYFLVIMPGAIVFRMVNGTAPFYSWTERCPEDAEGWVDKKCSDEGAEVSAAGSGRSPALQPLRVLGYFASNSELVLLPSLVMLLVLGMLGLFVQSSAIAPLIYTLF